MLPRQLSQPRVRFEFRIATCGKNGEALNCLNSSFSHPGNIVLKLVFRIVREPLFHFLLIGMAIFLAYSALNEPTPEAASEKQVEVTVSDVNQMITQFQGAWRRAPNRDELNGLIDAHVRENIMVQEALALSMDKGDAVIERRLSQKMAFLLESAAGAVTPNDDDLKAYFEEN